MKIRTKAESVKAVKTLGVNQFPEILLTEVDEEKIKSFLEETKSEWYVIRDKTVVASSKVRSVKPNEVIDYCKEADISKFTIGVSFRDYKKYHICVGELHIHGDTVDYFLSNNPDYSPRDLLKDPDHSGTAHLFDKKLRYIKGLQTAIDYAFEYNLIDMIVEFSVFSHPVGIKNEKVVIWELRTDY